MWQLNKRTKQPVAQEGMRRSKLLAEEVSYQIKEAYKTARTNILFAIQKKEGCHTIVLTSAIPGEGKTTTTLNTAIAFAMTGVKVLVIDADLRKPKVHQYANIKNETGLANYLGGFCKLEECIAHSKEWGLDCIPSGAIPPNPAELLSSPLLQEGLDSLKQKYDFIFIDTPPVNMVTDGIIVSKLADEVLIVVRQKYTANEALKKALSTLQFAEANVVGFIMNDTEDEKQGYRYRYRKYYRYGKYYKYSDYKTYR